jgi:hypothetical protein
MLNNGNIKKKSKILQYHFYFSDKEELDNKEYMNRLIKYHKTIENDEFADYLKIEKYLHDSKVNIKKVNNNIIIELHYWKDEENRSCNGELKFIDSKIISWNKVIKTGHISRMNKEYIPYQYGYDEFYIKNNEKYVTIIFFNRGSRKIINTGIYYPMLTIKYKSIQVVEEKIV